MSKADLTPKSPDALAALLRHPAIWRAAQAPRSSAPMQALSTGYEQLDQLLPQGGWPTGDLVELLCPQWGLGEIQLLSAALAELSRQARWIVWVAPPWIPYGPALTCRDIALDKLIIVRAGTLKEQLWALEQCLASGACSAVLGWPQAMQTSQVKRLQLAAQKGRCLAAVLRPAVQLQQASPAPLRIELSTSDSHIRLRIVKCRGRWGSAWLQLPWWSSSTPLAPTVSDEDSAPVAVRARQLLRANDDDERLLPVRASCSRLAQEVAHKLPPGASS